jgi:hypothetical protein
LSTHTVTQATAFLGYRRLRENITNARASAHTRGTAE